MPAAKAVITTLSTKGQLILPKAVRDSRGWSAGDRIVVEETADGVLLKREPDAPLFRPTRLEDVAGMIKHDGPTISVGEMRAGAIEGAVERFRRAVESDRDCG